MRMRLVSLLLAALLSSQGRADPITVRIGNLDRVAYQKSYALLIGQVDYDLASGWTSVPGAPNRLNKIAAALRRQGFTPANIRIVSNLRGAGLSAVIRQFIDQHADPNARILVFYNGHGASLGQGTADEKGYLVPVDAPPLSDPSFASRALALDDVKKIIASSEANHTLVIFDSCFSGLVFDTLGNTEQVELTSSSWTSFRKRRVQIITAGDADQVVPQDDEFVDGLVAGLDGAARYAQSNVITADDLTVFLSHRVTQTTVRSGSAGLQSAGQFMFAQQVVSPLVPTTTGTIRSGERIVPKVRYYKKSLDGLVVLRALDKSGYSYEARHPEIGDIFITNSIGCGSNVDIEDVKALAKSLVRNGVPIRMINRFRQGDPNRTTIDLVTFRISNERALETPILTEQQIDSLRSCPTYFWTGQHSSNEFPVRNPEGKS